MYERQEVFIMKKFISPLIMISFATISLSGCSLFMANRTFVDEMDKDTDGLFVPGQDFPTVQGDKGKAYRSRKDILERTPSDGKQKELYAQELSLINELERLEDSLPEREYHHYMNYKNNFRNISEKIYFLRLSSIEERDQYLRGKNLISANNNQSWQENLAIRSQEVYVGMSKEAVTRSWGRPLRIDVAGNPQHENERWTFYQNGQTYYVFFESGQVKGWQGSN